MKSGGSGNHHFVPRCLFCQTHTLKLDRGAQVHVPINHGWMETRCSFITRVTEGQTACVLHTLLFSSTHPQSSLFAVLSHHFFNTYIYLLLWSPQASINMFLMHSFLLISSVFFLLSIPMVSVTAPWSSHIFFPLFCSNGAIGFSQVDAVIAHFHLWFWVQVRKPLVLLCVSSCLIYIK